MLGSVLRQPVVSGAKRSRVFTAWRFRQSFRLNPGVAGQVALRRADPPYPRARIPITVSRVSAPALNYPWLCVLACAMSAMVRVPQAERHQPQAMRSSDPGNWHSWKDDS